MRILHAADLHLDSAFAGLAEEKAALLRQESRDILRRMVDWANDHAVDVMLLSGDLFDSDRMYSQTARTLAQALARFRGRIFLSPGNHDFYAPGSGYDAVDWPENVHIFTSRRPQTVLLRSLNASVTGAAFTSAEEWEPFDGASFSGGDAPIRLGVLHGEVTRGESKYRAIPPAEIEKTNLTYLALGHVHRCAGVQRAGNTAYAYPGCLPGRGFDETGDKGVCIVTLEEEAKIQAVSLDTVRFFDLEADAGADPVAALESLLPPQGSRDFYRIALTGNADVDIQSIYREFPDFPNLFLLDKTEPPIDLWENTDSDTLEGMYFQLLRRAMEEQPENARQIQLAAEISRKLLDGREVKV